MCSEKKHFELGRSTSLIELNDMPETLNKSQLEKEMPNEGTLRDSCPRVSIQTETSLPFQAAFNRGSQIEPSEEQLLMGAGKGRKHSFHHSPGCGHSSKNVTQCLKGSEKLTAREKRQSVLTMMGGEIQHKR
eukprot:GHVR01084836.1.p1 GENE.GHVR01084836.1~~GHVR01084836.1.p1  ORF type:complete len:132 (-),score=13.70 GHVR01084836.1:383-778(-)